MIDDLKALVATVETQSLTRAATRLNLTQSAVSRRIQQLEETLGGLLFDRTERPPKPTALGMRVYEHALPILQGVSDLVALPKENADATGVLRIGITPAIGDVVVAEVLASMKASFPNLRIRLRTDWSTGLSHEIDAGTLDAALLMVPGGSALPAPFVGRFVVSLDLAIVQSRHQPLFSRPVELSELALSEWVLNPLGCGYRANLENAMREGRGSLRVAVDTYGTETQLRVVAAGLGLGLVPRSVLRNSPNRDEIVPLDVRDFSMRSDVWLVHQPDQGNLRRVLDSLVAITATGLANQ